MSKQLSRKKLAESPDVYINRELSWLRFNERVLEEAENPANPILERAKFLAIFESNLDEFFMVRVSGLIEQVEAGTTTSSPDGLSPEEQVEAIHEVALPLRRRASTVYRHELIPALKKNSVQVLQMSELASADRAAMDKYFLREVFPVCTPLLLNPAPNVPFISNRSLNLAVSLNDGSGTKKLCRVKIPSVFPRFIRVNKRKFDYVLLEDLVQANLHHLFPGVSVEGSYTFRVIRDADIEIRELEAADLVSHAEQTIKMRRFGDPVLLQITPDCPSDVRRILQRLLLLDKQDIHQVEGPLGLEALWDLAGLDKPDLKYKPFSSTAIAKLTSPESLFDAIAAQDILVSHPFDSFASVETFVGSAAKDPNVIGIKQTLYRVGEHSTIVQSLLDAAEAGKQVAVMVELKARFDESNNLEWARQLERAGVHVTYGFADLKTHAKLCLVVRRESGSTRTYAHVGTGNYNRATARLYTDLGLFTADPEVTQDISELFNYLTGFSKRHQYRRLLVAPINLREGILERIQREIEVHTANKGGGHIVFKLNSLVDPETIDALYEASRVGVKIELLVRGICCLRPNVPGLSDNIRVISVVGRFLEHSRTYYFANAGAPELFLGSADLMRRNLDRRVEVLVPVRSASLIELVRKFVFAPVLKDNTNAWELDGEGVYRRITAKAAERFSSQEFQCVNPLGPLQFEKL
jgi:polyphosphate kinase